MVTKELVPKRGPPFIFRLVQCFSTVATWRELNFNSQNSKRPGEFWELKSPPLFQQPQLRNTGLACYLSHFSVWIHKERQVSNRRRNLRQLVEPLKNGLFLPIPPPLSSSQGDESSGEGSGSGCELHQCSPELVLNTTEVTQNVNKIDKKMTDSASSFGPSESLLLLSLVFFFLVGQRQWR